MKKLTLFYLDSCGYCQKAFRALEELSAANPAYAAVEIDKHEESREPELADRYDYYAVPSFFVDGDKRFEAHIGMSYEMIRDAVKSVLDYALEA